MKSRRQGGKNPIYSGGQIYRKGARKQETVFCNVAWVSYYADLLYLLFTVFCILNQKCQFFFRQIRLFVWFLRFLVSLRNDASEDQPTTTQLIFEPREIEETTILNLEPRISEENVEFRTEFYTAQPRISEVDLLDEFSAEDLQMDFNPDEITTINPK